MNWNSKLSDTKKIYHLHRRPSTMYKAKPCSCQERTVSLPDVPFSEANSTDLFKLEGAQSSRSDRVDTAREDFKRLIFDLIEI